MGCTAHDLPLDEHDFGAELRRDRRARVATRAGTDDDESRGRHVHSVRVVVSTLALVV